MCPTVPKPRRTVAPKPPEHLFVAASGPDHAALGGCKHSHRTPEAAVLCGQKNRLTQVWGDGVVLCEILLRLT